MKPFHFNFFQELVACAFSTLLRVEMLSHLLPEAEVSHHLIARDLNCTKCLALKKMQLNQRKV